MPDGVATGAPEIDPAFDERHDEAVTDVLIVGAGPTGLTLAAQLRAFGARFRIIDRSLDRAHESRALAVQARSLEMLQSLGLGEELVKRGNPSARLAIHLPWTVAAEVELGEFAATDTRFPFILFVSQAQTEAILGAHLAAVGVLIERGTELADFSAQGDLMRCLLRDRDGREKRVLASHIVGCDGAHSTVRKRAGIAFQGDAYLQDFVLGDVEVDGPLKPDTLHSFTGGKGIAMFFPLQSPATWRVIAMSAETPAARSHEGSTFDEPMTTDLSLEELQSMVDGTTGGELRLRDPAWLTHFRLHHRQAERYRADRVFLAGDAAHIHSPVGAQGMNTGIQDAWNLGWKLALVARGAAHPRLLDSYQAERWPVGRFLLRYTDRLFSVFVRTMSTRPLAAWIRRHVAARVLPRVLSSRRLRAFAFHFVSELGIHYRNSFAVTEGTPRLKAGPRAGNRLPDAQLMRNGERIYLQQSVGGPYLHLLLCGEAERWDKTRLAELATRYEPLLTMHFLTRLETPGALVDEGGEALRRLGVREAEAAQYLVRPDGYVGFRCAGRDLLQLDQYLATWFGAQDDLRTG